MSNKYWMLGLAGILLVFGYFLFQFVSSTLKIETLVDQIQPNQVEDQPSKHVVLIAQELDNPFWRAMENGANKVANELGMSIDYRGPLRISPSEQSKLLEKAIAAKPDAIVLQGITDANYELLIGEAIEQGIPVITVDADEPNSQRIAYVGTDNYEAGKRMGELVIKDDDGDNRGHIGVIIGSDLADNQRLRLEGLRAVIANTPGYEIIDVRASNISRIGAAKQTESMLNIYDNMGTIVGLSSLDASGILEGIQATDRADVRVFGFDDLEETRQSIAQGAIIAAVVQQPQEIGSKAVYLLKAIFQQRTVPVQNLIHTEIMNREQLQAAAGSQ